ncbi:hypothetical protein AVEN_118093-1 [Araneus ventricosus]|uniref:Uncharacterized protein n=1 Tax=Araneus ventricosus TaxID=182803 RepID=A0A4Y2J200_ARAVE|nr:hypothetical protein AVEN_118093-1 [Araneus ventricosus]
MCTCRVHKFLTVSKWVEKRLMTTHVLSERVRPVVSTSEEFSIFIGYLQAEQSANNISKVKGYEENDLICGKIVYDFLTRSMPQIIIHSFSKRFGQEPDPRCRTLAVFT